MSAAVSARCLGCTGMSAAVSARWLCLGSSIMPVVHRMTWAATWQNQQNECAPSEDSDQPGHPPSLIRVFTVRMKKLWVLSYPLIAQQRLWSDLADAQADLSLRWAHMPLCWFCHAAAHITIIVTTGSDQNDKDMTTQPRDCIRSSKSGWIIMFYHISCRLGTYTHQFFIQFTKLQSSCL